MKTMIMTVILMSVCLGINHSLKANTMSGSMASMSVSTISSSTSQTIKPNQHQLKKELTQSVHSLTISVKQTVGAVVDVATGVIAYVFLSIGQAIASIVLD